jgi:leucyl/phenylalanyl-tRNA--protein transferase
MPITAFPEPHRATGPDGLLAVGGDLTVASLRLAYASGIFPWPGPGLPLVWFCPPERAVLHFADLHVPRSLARTRRRLSSELTFTIDRAFPDVIAACRRVRRPGQSGTWITPAMERAYVRLHRAGDAHSAEAWDAGGNLVGGIYGVDAGGAFSGESMFFTRPYASKLALLHLIEHLQSRGLDWLDIQMLTPVTASLGGRYIPRDTFLDLLAETRSRARPLFDRPTLTPPTEGTQEEPARTCR